ncbi:CPBP family intramembrane metalloprotease [Corallococcus sp. AB004]|nr:CPBP family intramembrane metalloprotease [Corallococcus sp. AB038B]RKI49107.1 CPBP family intramembrane metalloprotease [Corallococcus sp. AB004]
MLRNMRNPRKETLTFIAVTLAVSWTMAVAFIAGGEKSVWLMRWMMCVPGIVGLACSWFFRREPPSAVGFAFPGWKWWFLGLALPLAYGAVIAPLAYAIRFATGDASFITFQPQLLKGPFGVTGVATVPVMILLFWALTVTWWLAAASVRWRWVEKLGAKLPERWRWLRYGLAALVWGPVVGFGVPSELGEEVGWRGTLVRWWMHRPALAAAITMPVWAAFHLPLIFSSTQRGHVGQNVTFLLSIAVAAVVFAQLYMASRSIWPPALFHISWNIINPLLFGSVYNGRPGLFGGQVWVFNGEGVFGLLLHGLVAVWLFRHWKRSARTTESAVLPESSATPA